MSRNIVPPPEDRGDIIAMGHWVADCLEERDQLVHRTVVRGVTQEAERLRAALVVVHGYLVEGKYRVAQLVAEDQLNTPTTTQRNQV